MRLLPTLVLVPFLALPAFPVEAAPKQLAEMATSDWTVEVVAEDLDYPWDIERAGELIIATEKPGRIVIVENGALQRYDLATSDSILDQAGGGLLGMALAPDFAVTGRAFSTTPSALSRRR